MGKFKPFIFNGWTMNKYGVVYRRESDKILANWDSVTLANLKETDEVRAAAAQNGYVCKLRGKELVWSIEEKETAVTVTEVS